MSEKFDFAFAIPVERIVERDGSESLFLRGLGTSEAAIDSMVAALSGLPGVKGVRKVGEGKKTFGVFDWSGCLWEPKGWG